MLRPDLADLAFDRRTFDDLRAALLRGEASPERARLAAPPSPLHLGDPRLLALASAGPAHLADLRARGEAALRAGQIAALILNGGLATRFGGLVKGVVPALDDRPDRSFLAIKLAGIQRVADRLGAAVPVVLMHSFATRRASDAHLAALDWAGIPPDARLAFVQSVLPRLDLTGALLLDRPGADAASDLDLYAAPGHGDALRRLDESGVADALRRRGVRHLFISNVDNLAATLDPVLAGAHLAGARPVSVEVVRRREGDAGGVIAELDGRAVIVEGLRLPASDDPARYHHFNTNTLWLDLDAARVDPPLDYFPIHRAITWPDGQLIETLHFEQLLGQITERAPAAFVEVDRDRRFLPIKTQADLRAARPRVAELVAAAFAP